MRSNFFGFSISRLNDFKKAVVNVFIFLPYFFSVTNLFKTLFLPWKNIQSKKTGTGFSFQEFSARLSLNLVSSGIGFFLRIGLILVFVVVQSLFVIILPFITAIYIFLLPLSYLINVNQKTDQEIKDNERSKFYKARMLISQNIKDVEVWFEIYYDHFLKKTNWSELSNLFSYPPLGRDWSSGFTPLLDQFASEPTLETSGKPRLIGRTKEISAVEQILAKSGLNNVILVGENGVGKRTIIEGLADKIYRGYTLPSLTYKRVLEVDMTKIISTSVDEAVRDQTTSDLFAEAEEAKNIILLIPNIEKYIDPKSNINLTEVLEKFAQSENLQIICATTPYVYEKYLFQNEKLSHVFSRVDVIELTSNEALRILEEKAFEIEAKSGCIISFEALKETIEKSAFFITDIPFPEKAIELLDETCVMATKKNTNSKTKITIIPTMIDNTITIKTHIPIILSQSYKDKLLSLEALLKKKIIQQDEGIEKLSAMLRKSIVLSSTRKKPLASFLFLGPTGVGKTETAKAIHEIFFGQESKMLRLDMSFYQLKSDVANLIGSPELGSPGILTGAVRVSPYGVLLLDEIEKASIDLLNIFLTVLDEGYFVDGFGKRVDCKNLIIIATSNAASDYLYSSSDQSKISSAEMINFLIENHKFTAEFLNRFDGVILYKPLTEASLELIAKSKLQKLALEVLDRQKIQLKFSEEFIHSLASKNFDPKFGARNLDRSIRDLVEDKIATEFLSGGDKLKSMEF